MIHSNMAYICNDCGYSSQKWIGKCPNCGSWNIKETTAPSDSSNKRKPTNLTKLLSPNDIKKQQKHLQRIPINMQEPREVLGDLVPSGLYLIGGEPGVGKSTLLLQLLIQTALQKIPSVYVSSEESCNQIFQRLKRLTKKLPSTRLQTLNEYLSFACSNLIDEVIPALESNKPSVVVFDSIQGFTTLSSSGVIGGPSQIREVTHKIARFIKTNSAIGLLVGQVTKGGDVSGPKLIEHLVDVVAYLEYGGISSLRILRTTKNRFHEVGTLGFLEMTPAGFKSAKDIYKAWINQKDNIPPGVSYGTILYGNRPLAVQVQALLVDSKFANPRRVVEGFSKTKLEVLIAVTQQHIKGINLSYKDVFLKVLGGIQTKDPGIDLAVIAALVGAYKKIAYPNTIFIGEVGLLGNIAAPYGYKERLKEAKNLRFETIVDHTSMKRISELL